MPLWLTVAAVPCIYAFALYAGCESLVHHLTFWNEKRRPSVRALAGVAAGLRASLADISEFRGLPAKRAARTKSFQEARQAVRDFKVQRGLAQAARAEARERLVRYAGVPGVGDDGLQLDRREFAETKSALLWLATCHMGWYQRDDRPDAYRRDLLTVIGSFPIQGLSDDHGIVTKVRKDRQAWYAYRATPSGLVFGIGAVRPPPSQWYYDGPEPPKGFPSKKTGWTTSLDPERPEWGEERPTT